MKYGGGEGMASWATISRLNIGRGRAGAAYWRSQQGPGQQVGAAIYHNWRHNDENVVTDSEEPEGMRHQTVMWVGEGVRCAA